MRKSDEAKRIGNETARQTAEQARAEAEARRHDAETERSNAETARAEAEVKREKDTKDGIASMQTATETAIDQLHDYGSAVEKKEALRVAARRPLLCCPRPARGTWSSSPPSSGAAGNDASASAASGSGVPLTLIS